MELFFMAKVPTERKVKDYGLACHSHLCFDTVKD